MLSAAAGEGADGVTVGVEREFKFGVEPEPVEKKIRKEEGETR